MSALDAAVADTATAARRIGGQASRIGYIGWLGHGNLGDEAMRAAAERLLGRRVEPLLSAPRERVLAAVGASGARAFSAVILGGGTLINEGRLALVEDCLARGVPLVALGTGVGSAGLSAAEERLDPRWVAALARFRGVGVRGPISAGKLAAAGFAGASVVGDLALALTPEEPAAGWGGGHYLLNLAPARLDEDRVRLEAVEAAFAEAVGELAGKGLEPIPVAFDPADHAALSALLERAGRPGTTIEAPADFAGYRLLAGRARFALGVRLHSAVFAAACGVPPLLIGYRDKCRDFAESVGLGGSVVDLAQFDAVAFRARLAALHVSPETAGRRLHTKCRELAAGLARFADEHLMLLLRRG